MKKFISGNTAVAEAVRLCRTQIVAAYPITPQTPIYEKLSDWDAEGKLGGIMMRTESEHSAMAACLSASLAGARVFTATSSQGIALMHEMLHFASGCRTPVVMVNVNRTLAAPWAFWSDQTDSLAQRDTGWIQIYCEDNQEALDSTIQAYRIAEKLLLPCMVVLEAHYISHFMEPVSVPEQEEVDAFVGAIDVPNRFDVENPGYLIPQVSSEEYMYYRRKSQEAMSLALEVIPEVGEDYDRAFGRRYGLIETMECDDADLVLVTTASITSTARIVISSLRKKGIKVGLLKIRVFRPFPTKALRAALVNISRIAVIDRNISLGREGIFCSELKSALIHSKGHHMVQGYLAGIGGVDVDGEMIESIVKDALQRDEATDGPIWMMEKK